MGRFGFDVVVAAHVDAVSVLDRQIRGELQSAAMGTQNVLAREFLFGDNGVVASTVVDHQHRFAGRHMTIVNFFIFDRLQCEIGFGDGGGGGGRGVGQLVVVSIGARNGQTVDGDRLACARIFVVKVGAALGQAQAVSCEPVAAQCDAGVRGGVVDLVGCAGADGQVLPVHHIVVASGRETCKAVVGRILTAEGGGGLFVAACFELAAGAGGGIHDRGGGGDLVGPLHVAKAHGARIGSCAVGGVHVGNGRARQGQLVDHMVVVSGRETRKAVVGRILTAEGGGGLFVAACFEVTAGAGGSIHDRGGGGDLVGPLHVAKAHSARIGGCAISGVHTGNRHAGQSQLVDFVVAPDVGKAVVVLVNTGQATEGLDACVVTCPEMAAGAGATGGVDAHTTGLHQVTALLVRQIHRAGLQGRAVDGFTLGDGAGQGQWCDLVVALDVGKAVVVHVGTRQAREGLNARVHACFEMAAGAGAACGVDVHTAGAHHVVAHLVGQVDSAWHQGVAVSAQTLRNGTGQGQWVDGVVGGGGGETCKAVVARVRAAQGRSHGLGVAAGFEVAAGAGGGGHEAGCAGCRHIIAAYFSTQADSARGGACAIGGGDVRNLTGQHFGAQGHGVDAAGSHRQVGQFVVAGQAAVCAIGQAHSIHKVGAVVRHVLAVDRGETVAQGFRSHARGDAQLRARECGVAVVGFGGREADFFWVNEQGAVDFGDRVVAIDVGRIVHGAGVSARVGGFGACRDAGQIHGLAVRALQAAAGDGEPTHGLLGAVVHLAGVAVGGQGQRGRRDGAGGVADRSGQFVVGQIGRAWREITGGQCGRDGMGRCHVFAVVSACRLGDGGCFRDAAHRHTRGGDGTGRQAGMGGAVVHLGLIGQAHQQIGFVDGAGGVVDVGDVVVAGDIGAGAVLEGHARRPHVFVVRARVLAEEGL